MNKDIIIPAILGALITVLGTCVGWLFNSITTLQHEKTLLTKDIEYVKLQVDENKQTGVGIWEEIDSQTASDKLQMVENYKFANELIGKTHNNEIAIKDLKIEMLESQLNGR